MEKPGITIYSSGIEKNLHPDCQVGSTGSYTPCRIRIAAGLMTYHAYHSSLNSMGGSNIAGRNRIYRWINIYHPQILKNPLLNKLIPGKAGDFFNQYPSYQVENIVVGIAGSKAIGKRYISQAFGNFPAGESSGRPEKEIPGTKTKATVMHQQIPNSYFARYNRIRKCKPG